MLNYLNRRNLIFFCWPWEVSFVNEFQPWSRHLLFHSKFTITFKPALIVPLRNLIRCHHFLLIHSPHFIFMSVVYQNTLMTYQNFFLHWTGLPLAVIAVLIRIIDLPCYHKVFVQKERTWIISSSLIRIGIIPYYDSSLLGLRFTGFGLSFLDFIVNVECEKTASTTSILSMQVPEKVIQMACYDLRPFYSVPEVERFKCIFTDLLENALFWWLKTCLSAAIMLAYACSSPAPAQRSFNFRFRQAREA